LHFDTPSFLFVKLTIAGMGWQILFLQIFWHLKSHSTLPL